MEHLTLGWSYRELDRYRIPFPFWTGRTAEGQDSCPVVKTSSGNKASPSPGQRQCPRAVGVMPVSTGALGNRLPLEPCVFMALRCGSFIAPTDSCSFSENTLLLVGACLGIGVQAVPYQFALGFEIGKLQICFNKFSPLESFHLMMWFMV